jgi:hypothetical protein
MLVRVIARDGRTRIVADTLDAELARIAFTLHSTAARAGMRTELVCDGAVIDVRVSERRAVYRAARAPRQGRLF